MPFTDDRIPYRNMAGPGTGVRTKEKDHSHVFDFVSLCSPFVLHSSTDSGGMLTFGLCSAVQQSEVRNDTFTITSNL